MTESTEHFEGRAALYASLKLAFGDRASFGSSQFVYWDASDPRRCLAPDVFVRLGVAHEPVRSWKVWERGAPQIAIEIVSDDDRPERVWADKLGRYHAVGVAELVRFDPEDLDQPLRIWDRVEGDLVERELETPDLAESSGLSIQWVVVEDSSLGPTLRARDARGLIPTPEELARASQQDATLARAEAERERERAERERERAERERERAERERERADRAGADLVGPSRARRDEEP